MAAYTIKPLVTAIAHNTAEALALAQETHANICPYSHATRGNIEFALEAEGA